MFDRLLKKFEHFAVLPEHERQDLWGICQKRRKMIAPRQPVYEEGDKLYWSHLVMDGWAVRERLLDNGRKQAVGLLVDGDSCGYAPDLEPVADHSLKAVTQLEIARLTRSDVESLRQHANIKRVFDGMASEALAIQRDWTLNVGQRSALERAAHLFCELYYRLARIGAVEGDRFAMPMAQNEIGECLSMSTVHVNRSMKTLRSERLIDFQRGSVIILDHERLKALAGFDPAYLSAGHQSERSSDIG